MRSTSSRGFVHQMLVYPLLAIGFTGSIGLGTVWMRHQISVTANENKAVENRLAEVERLSEQTATWIAEEQDDNALLRKNAAYKLGMVPPRPDQVIRGKDGDAIVRLESKHNQGLVPQEVEAVTFRVASQR